MRRSLSIALLCAGMLLFLAGLPGVAHAGRSSSRSGWRFSASADRSDWEPTVHLAPAAVGLSSEQKGPDGDDRKFTWENFQLSTETHAAGPWEGSSIEWVPDAHGRPGILRVQSTIDEARDFTLGYDAFGRFTGSSSAEVASVLGRDDAGRPSTLSQGTISSGWTYDGIGRLATHNYSAGGFQYSYTQYDKRNRLINRHVPGGIGWSGIIYGDADQVIEAGTESKRLLYAYDGRGSRNMANGVVGYTINDLCQATKLTTGTRDLNIIGSATPKTAIRAYSEFPPQTGELWQVDPVTGHFSGGWQVPQAWRDGGAGLVEAKIRGTLAGKGDNQKDAVADVDLNVVIPPVVEELTYDGAGRLKSDAFWDYSFDGAGRLKSMNRKSPYQAPRVVSEKVDFTYDAEGRRTVKVHTVIYRSKKVEKTESRILWAGWLPVLEEQLENDVTVGKRWFQWGPDLSGTIDGAGGIGGLVAIIEERAGKEKRVLLPVQDGLGNVMAVINSADGKILARYEYSPFGESLSATGDTSVCPFRYQTKWLDEESQHYYFGYRYYDPRTSRWLSRDPMGEAGGFNLYAYCGNDPVNRHDYLGMAPISKSAPTDDLIAEEIDVLTAMLAQQKDVALHQNSEDCIGWRPSKFVKWGAAGDWNAVDFLRNVQKSRKDLGPNGYGTFNTIGILNRNFGDLNEDVRSYFVPEGGFVTSAGMRLQLDAVSKIGAYTAIAATEILPGPADLLLAGMGDVSAGYEISGLAMAKDRFFRSGGVRYSSTEAHAVMAEASIGLGINTEDIVDDVFLRDGVGEFTLQSGRRVIYVSEQELARGREFALRHVFHEIGHAQEFDKLVVRFAGDRGKAWRYMMGKARDYARSEVIVDRLARMRLKRYFGELSPEVEGEIYDYIETWKREMK